MSGLACLAALTAIQMAEGGETAPLPPVEAAEIVITGERVRRTVRDTPSSVVVFTANDLNARADFDRLDNLLEQIPNIQIGAGTQGPTIRGQDSTGVLQDLPAFVGGTRPRITLQIDGRAVSYSEFVSGVAPLWDVERVEVFRSPQSTTQGRNSIAGAIFVTTNDPTYEWEGRARLIHASFDTWQGSAVTSGPIVDGQLAIRLSGDVRTSRNPNKIMNSVVIGADPNRDRYWNIRAKILAQPIAIPGFRMEASYFHQDSRQPPAEGVIPPFEKRRGSRGAAVSDNNVDSLTAVTGYDFTGALKLTGTISAGRVNNRRFAPRGLGETLTDIRDRSIETLLDWEPSERLSARLGLHLLRNKLDQFIDLTQVFGVGKFVDDQRSVGLFGEVEFDPAPGLTLTAGLRYQRDRQDREGLLGNPFFPAAVDFEGKYDSWLPKLVMSYDFSERIAAGLLVQRGYNPGGVTINFDTGQQDEFDQESVWSYELFGRATLADGRLWLTANLFRSDFKDAQRAEQRSFTIPGQGTAFWSLIHNVAEARSRGLEAAVDWRATDRLKLRSGIGLLRTRISDDGPAAFANNVFGRAPRFTGTASVEWRPIDGLYLNADIRHHSGYFSDDLNTRAFRIDKATVVNARVAYEANRLTISAYATNLFDRFYLTSIFSPAFATLGDPREIGFGLDLRF